MSPHPASRNTAVFIAGVVLAVALGASALGYALAASSSPERKASGSVTVNASASLTGVPDTLTVQLSVTNSAASAAGALNANNVETRHLEHVFESNGVKPSDLQTQNLNVSPSYNQNGQLTGYRAEDDLSATLHGIAKAGRVIASAENAVGNDVAINGITFSLSHNSALFARARVLAVRNARNDARAFAKGAGETVGPALRMTNIEQTSTPVPFNEFHAAASAPNSVPLRPGTSSVSVQVTVTFALVI